MFKIKHMLQIKLMPQIKHMFQIKDMLQIKFMLHKLQTLMLMLIQVLLLKLFYKS
jgi:hypothetical protein